MIKEREVFINHVISTVENQLLNHGEVIAAAEFSHKVYEDILMFLPEIKAIAREKDIDLEEEVIPNSLLVIKIVEKKKNMDLEEVKPNSLQIIKV